MGFCDLPMANKLCTAADLIDFANDPGKAITEGIGNWIAKSVGELAMASADLAVDGITATTKIDLNATWFKDNYETLLPIGLVMLVATMCAQLLRAAIKRDGQALTQAFTGTFMGVIFSFSAIALTTVAIEVVDALSDGLFAAAGTSMEEAVRRSIKASVIGGVAGLGWMVPAFVGIGTAVGAFMFWCVMLMRKVGILVLVTLAVFAGAAWRLGGRTPLAARLGRGHRNPRRLQAPDDRHLHPRHLRPGQHRGQGRHPGPGRRHGRHRDHVPGLAGPVRDVQVRALGRRRHGWRIHSPCRWSRCTGCPSAH